MRPRSASRRCAWFPNTTYSEPLAWANTRLVGEDPVEAVRSLKAESTRGLRTIGSLTTARYVHTAALLPTGKVLVAGGAGPGDAPLGSAELYDPASLTWAATGSLATGRYLHTATLLPSGKVLVAGGLGTSGYLASAEVYDVGLGFVRPDWQPQITTATSPLILGTSLVLTGSRFQGISQASGGNYQDSSTNYPVVQLRAIDSSHVAEAVHYRALDRGYFRCTS